MTSGSSDVPPARKPATIFLGAEIGIGIRYFCQTGILRELVARGLEVVVLVPNPTEVRELLAEELPAIRVEKLRLDRLDLGFATGLAAWIRSLIYVSANHLRITGMSRKMNLAVPRDYRKLVERQWKLTRSRQRYLIPFLATVAMLLRRNRGARKIFERVLDYRPLDKFHDELFEQYSPSLVVTSSTGWWPGEEMLLREAKARGLPTLGVVAGWDHPCSKGLPGARPRRVAAWSEIHRKELVLGSDFDEHAIDISGPVHFDIYRDPGAAAPREAYLRSHNLDPDRLLITFGCSFVGMSPNLVIVQALAEAIAADAFGVPVQLLVRLHPSHLKPAVGKYREVRQEAAKYYDMAEQFPHVHIDAPVLGKQQVPSYTQPADARNLASLFAHTDVFVTLFSTMVLESCFNDVPVVAAAFDPPSSKLEDFLPISKTLDWPTHHRIIRSGAASVVRDPHALVDAVRQYLANRQLHSRERRAFAEQECTFLDGRCAGRLASLMDRLVKPAGREAAPNPAQKIKRDQKTRQSLVKR
jgi:glycosyltransferase involved in cell wall biosynthesis